MKHHTLLFTVLFAFALLLQASAQETRLLREPAISARHIAFVYAGDIWLADRDGKNTRRLTTHSGTEGAPQFSPDGAQLAFSGEYDGNYDVFVVSVDGGEPKRLTWHPQPDIVKGWTPDGQSVVFASGRENAPYS